MSYRVRMLDSVTGEVVEYDQDLEWFESSFFWWQSGNMSCDCNRRMDFERSKGNFSVEDEDLRCGEDRYYVLGIFFGDGSVVRPDAPDGGGDHAMTPEQWDLWRDL